MSRDRKENEQSRAEAVMGLGGVGTAVSVLSEPHFPEEGTTDPGAECCEEECVQKWEVFRAEEVHST